MNPIIFFDELDKVSDTARGQEIIGILTHMTDTTQNNQFSDKFFSEITFDISKCLFIFSYNDETKINPILKDRMYCINTKGYSKKEKVIIAKNHLLPKIREQIKIKEEDVLFTDELLEHIVEIYCNKEEGVRNFKRCLETIYTKINLFRLMQVDTLFGEEVVKINFPVQLTKKYISKLLKEKSDDFSMNGLYV
jgi:ATP-dependent Lon protease